MPALRVREDEGQGGPEDDGEEEKEDKRIAQLHNTVHLYSAASCLLVVPLLLIKSVLYQPRLLNYAA